MEIFRRLSFANIIPLGDCKLWNRHASDVDDIPLKHDLSQRL